MKITFVRPNFNDMRSSDAMQPLVFSILYGLTPPNIETTLLDERLEPINYDDETDLVAITVETFTAGRAYEIATQFRKRGVQVVMGGYHPTFLPEEALQYADSVVIGDAEGVWEQVVEDKKKHKLQKIYTNNSQGSLEGLKYDRNIFKDKKYFNVLPIQYSRGCRFSCDFCSIHAFYGRNLRQRSVQDIVKEIETHEPRHVFFVDDNIFVDLSKAHELFQALIPLKISWSCQVSIDIAKDDKLMNLMEKSGCMTAVIGFESLDEQNLIQMKKKWNLKHNDYSTSIQKFHDRGIMIYATFIFGYDYDTVDSFDSTLEFAIRNKFFLANFNPLTPTPGSRLYDRLKKEDRLLYDQWWLNSDFRYGETIFQPKSMTADQLTEGCLRTRLAFNRYSSILKRAIDFKTNCRSPYRLALYFKANLISRKEILSKQGIKLGDIESLKIQ